MNKLKLKIGKWVARHWLYTYLLVGIRMPLREILLYKSDLDPLIKERIEYVLKNLDNIMEI